MAKKILIFIEDGSFTYDNRVKRIANSLYDNGYELTIISPRTKGDRFFRKIDKNYRALFFPKFDAESTLMHLLEHLITLVSGFCLTLWVKIRYGFNVFYACNPTDILWILALPYKLFGTKFIFDQHDLSPEVYLSRSGTTKKDTFYKVLLWLEKMSYKLADKVIVTNESYKANAIKRGNKKESDVVPVRNGPVLEKFSNIPYNTNPHYKKESEILIGYLGNMNSQDGVDQLLYAANDIVKNKKEQQIRFVFIGGGSYQPNLVKLSSEMGLDNYVTFTGRIPDDEMLNILGETDICVQPDPYNPLNDVSTMNKVMEYMALGKPVVAFNLTETVVSGGECVVYADKFNENDLADKILYLAKNDELREELGKKGRKRVEEKLEWKHSVPNLLKAFDTL